MKRSAIVGTSLLAGLLLTACNAQQQQPDINVNTGASQTGVSVTGSGVVTGTPDTVEVDLGISVLGETVEAAAAMAADKTNALIDALLEGGVSEEDISTTNYSIYPEYDYRDNQEKILGYRVTNTVRAKIRDIDQSGSVIDDAVVAGGDDTQVSGLRFSIEDDATLIEEARDAAWDDAFTKASQLAELSGQTLGAAVSINETVISPPMPYFSGGDLARAEDGFETPIEPGTSEVTITLSVQFSLDA